MPREWRELLEELAPVFARRPAHRLFMAPACWFFAVATWDLDAPGIAVARLIVKYLPSDGGPPAAAVDGTFFGR